MFSHVIIACGPAATIRIVPPTGSKARHPGNHALGSSTNVEPTISTAPQSDAQVDAILPCSTGNGRSASIAPARGSHMREAGE